MIGWLAPALALLKRLGGLIAVAWRSPLGRSLILCAVALVAVWAAHGRGVVQGRAEGVRVERAIWEARLAADKARAAKVAANQAEAGQQVGAAVETRLGEVRTVTRTILKEVPHYVTVQADARCDVPAGFVRLHDAAAAGVSPASDPAGSTADAPSGLALSTVAATVADNYGACRETGERLKGWQEWWARIVAASG